MNRDKIENQRLVSDCTKIQENKFPAFAAVLKDHTSMYLTTWQVIIECFNELLQGFWGKGYEMIKVRSLLGHLKEYDWLAGGNLDWA